MSNDLGITIEEFAEKYIDIIDYDFNLWEEDLEQSTGVHKLKTLVLRGNQKENCTFLFEEKGKKLCQIYRARPFQCRGFPFWSMIMTQEKVFNENVDFCAGFHTADALNGFKYFTPEDISILAKEERKIERKYVLEMEANDFNIVKIYPFLTARNFQDAEKKP